MLLVISQTKLGRFWWNLIDGFLNTFAIKWCKRFHLTWIMSIHYLVKLEMLIAHVLPLSWYRRNSRIYPTSTVASKFTRFEPSWSQRVGNIARDDVKNTHHWSIRTETATENRVEQAGSRCHCGSHPSAASWIAPDQWCMFCTPSCYIFHTLLSTGLILRLWRPQLRWDKFWSFSV